ncbi:hypothetical protein KDAU_30950 [Dictyobacter aurantiacus]|uniref:Uncharacterized protein n=1 Tax=Dictyobacter aurantiacus TaxID=1936993 RepID=A0A401ZG05_9CHLR|nr:hypothetical protein KDAU_30950 [Dictyobacter aurantiacus]
MDIHKLSMQLLGLWIIRLSIVSIIFAASNAVRSGSTGNRLRMALLNLSQIPNKRAFAAAAELIIVLLEIFS